MVVAKKLLLSAGLIASATAAVIPHRRTPTHVARILPEGGVPPAPQAVPKLPGVVKPILDLSKLGKVGSPKVEAEKDDDGRRKDDGKDKEDDGKDKKDDGKDKGKGNGKGGDDDGEVEQTTTNGAATTTDAAEATTTSEVPTETTAPPPGETAAPGEDQETNDEEDNQDEQEGENQEDENQNDQQDENDGEEQQDQPPADGVAATKGLLVQFAVSADQAGAFKDVLVGAVPAIEAEPLTLSWFGATVKDSPENLLVFDTFADDAGRAAHLAGEVAASVIAATPNFVGGLSIDAFDILAIKNADPALASTVTLGLHASFEAQEDKIADVEQFCADSLAIAEAEAGTINWLCGKWPGTAKFLILDSFVDQAGLDAHLAGEIAQNLVGLADDTLVAAPIIDQIDVVAASVKTGAPAEDTEVPPPAAGGGAAIDVARASESVTDSANFGLFVPFTALPEAAAAVQDFVQGATALAAAEPGTLQWFAGVVGNESSVDFLVFDTFATAADRDAHLAGKVASGLLGQIAALSSVDIVPFDMIAIKSLNDDAAVASETSGVTVGLELTFSAVNDDRVTDVVTLCQAGLEGIQAETGTLNWACSQITDTANFLIVASFATVEDRNTHIQGEFTSSLVALATQQNDDAFVVNLSMKPINIFAGTSKPEVGAGAGAGAGGEAGDAGENGEEPVETTTTEAPTATDTTTAPAETETLTTSSSESVTEAPQSTLGGIPAFLRWA